MNEKSFKHKSSVGRKALLTYGDAEPCGVVTLAQWQSRTLHNAVLHTYTQSPVPTYIHICKASWCMVWYTSRTVGMVDCSGSFLWQQSIGVLLVPFSQGCATRVTCVFIYSPSSASYDEKALSPLGWLGLCVPSIHPSVPPSSLTLTNHGLFSYSYY